MQFYYFSETTNSPKVLLTYAGRQNILGSILVWLKVARKVPTNSTREEFFNKQNKPLLQKSTNKIILGVAASF